MLAWLLAVSFLFHEEVTQLLVRSRGDLCFAGSAPLAPCLDICLWWCSLHHRSTLCFGLVVKLRCEVAVFEDSLQSLLLLPLQNVLNLEPVSKLLDVLASYDRITPLKVF